MRIDLLPDAAAAAAHAARFVAQRAREAVRERGRFLLALSGGATPLPMFEALSGQTLPWQRIELFQADERVAPRASAARNWTQIERLLLAPLGTTPPRTHPMPVESSDPADAAKRYAEALAALAGATPALDLVHLGLGADGHTASLFAGDPALDVDDAWVAATEVRHGYRRITLTVPTLNRACCVMWLVCGADKAEALARLLDGDDSIAAARVSRDRARVIADQAAGRGRGLRGQGTATGSSLATGPALEER